MAKAFTICSAILLQFFMISSIVLAAFGIPGHVYTVGQFGNAQQVAINSNKPITFIYSDKNTDCGLATAASQDIFQNLKNHSVIVYAERNDWNNLPAIVRNGMNSPESGQYIPKTVIVSPDLNRVICIIPYAKTKERNDLIQQAQNLLSSY
jgi:hypothetical protein